MKHPLGIAALLYLTGLLIAEFFQPPLSLLLSVSLAVAATAIFISRLRPFLVAPLLVLTGWTNMAFHSAIISPHDLRRVFDGAYEDVRVRGKLVETPNERVSVRDGGEVTHTLAQIDVSEVARNGKWQPASGRVVVFTSGELAKDYFAGQPVEIRGVISFPQLPVAEGLFNYRAYLRRQGIYFQLRALSAGDWQLLEPRQTTRPLSDRFLTWAQATLARGLPEEDEPLRLMWAMTLGWRAGITNEVYEPFMRSGTMHIFAISGLHIALIAGILVAVLRVVQVPRFWCGAIIIPLIWFYTAATGWQSSAIRSTIMMSIVVGGWALKRPSNLLNSLATAALIILLWQPQQLFQASFQLSFFVVLSIALIQPPLNNLRDRLLQTDPMRPAQLLPRWQQAPRGCARWLLTAAATSLAAWLGAWPLSAHYFHLFSPVTLLANLLIVPASSAALACNLGSLACGAWLPWLSELFNHAGWFFMRCMVGISHWSADLPGAFRYVPSPALSDFVIYYALLFAVLAGWLFAGQNRRWLYAVCIALAVFYFWRWQNERESVVVTALPLNGGSAIFCDQPGARDDLLVNCGNESSVHFTVTPFLRAQGVKSLSQLLLTHGDLRNVGGAELLCDNFAVQTLLASNVRFRSPTYRKFLETLPQRLNGRQTICRGSELSGWTVLHPVNSENFPRADDNTVVLRGELKGVRMLLLSDLGRPGQNALLEREKDLRAEIAIAGLPERGEPLCDALLEAIQPKLIIVTDSELPATRRAPLKLRTRLKRHGAVVLYTRNCGGVKLTLKKGSWLAETAMGEIVSSATVSNVPVVMETKLGSDLADEEER